VALFTGQPKVFPFESKRHMGVREFPGIFLPPGHRIDQFKICSIVFGVTRGAGDRTVFQNKKMEALFKFQLLFDFMMAPEAPGVQSL
jgi:hypothetical protein